MRATKVIEVEAGEIIATERSPDTDLLRLTTAPKAASAVPDSPPGVVVGELVAITGDSLLPLVVFPGQNGSAALVARSVVDLHAGHIGKQIALMFESGDATRPIIVGLLRGGTGWPLDQRPNNVEVHAEGERLIVRASEELVLKCGLASITLTKAGKVVIQGTYVSSRSAGVNRIRGGSVQIN